MFPETGTSRRTAVLTHFPLLTINLVFHKPKTVQRSLSREKHSTAPQTRRAEDTTVITRATASLSRVNYTTFTLFLSTFVLSFLLYTSLLRFLYKTKTKQKNTVPPSPPKTNPQTRVNLDCTNSRLRIENEHFGNLRVPQSRAHRARQRTSGTRPAAAFQWGDWKSCQPTEKHFNLHVN